jgi:hypothetical protein
LDCFGAKVEMLTETPVFERVTVGFFSKKRKTTLREVAAKSALRGGCCGVFFSKKRKTTLRQVFVTWVPQAAFF